MSIFNEKDQYFKDCFSKQFSESDSDEDSDSKGANKSTISDKHTILCPESENGEILESATAPRDNVSIERKRVDILRNESSNIEREFITISSDDDDNDDEDIEIQDILMSSHRTRQSIGDQTSSGSLNDSTLCHEPMELKVMIAGDYMRFPTTYGAPLHEAFRSYIKELRNNNKTLIISLNGRELSLEQSALELEIDQATILHGIEISKAIVNDVIAEDSNKITVKLQDGCRRNTREIKICQTDQLIELKKKYAELLDIKELGTIKLKFDGDLVNDHDTPMDLDLEGGEAFDVVFS